MFEELNRILVAEDHATSRQLLARHLVYWGYQVIVAADGSEALRLLELPGAPCIAILDWMMPRVDGLEVCRRIRSQNVRPFQYLMILSSRRDRANLEESGGVGADDFVSKPFLIDELRARIRVAQRVVALERKCEELEQKMGLSNLEMKQLRGLFPACPLCGARREDQIYWSRVDQYARAHSREEFDGCLCEKCVGSASGSVGENAATA